MKNAIREFLPYTKKEKERIWEKGTFVFDTNVLLNLYRYSRNTREDLLGALAKLSHRIWMPYHVAYEFMKNRSKVISDAVANYEKTTIALMDEIQKRLSSLRIDKSYINHIIKYNKRKLTEYEHRNIEITNADEDDVLNTLLNLFENKVGPKYTPDQLIEIKKEGAKRYEKCIPPGYKDAQKAKESKNDDNNAYGDYIIWHQMMTFSADNKMDIIFVVDDRKDDWWEVNNGKCSGARQELLVEFFNVSGMHFLIYNMHSFLERLNDMRGYEVNPQTISETSKLSRLTDNEEQEILKRMGYDINYLQVNDMLSEYENAIKTMNKFTQSKNELETIIKDNYLYLSKILPSVCIKDIRTARDLSDQSDAFDQKSDSDRN